MKDIKGTLTRIDGEIIQRRQQIAYHQVEIARLEDTRRVLMGLVESDIEAAEAERNPDTPRIAAEQSIIVRKIGAADPGDLASRAHQHNGGGDAAGLNASGNRRGMTTAKAKHVAGVVMKKKRATQDEIPPELRLGAFKQRVLVALKASGKPMDTTDLRQALGLMEHHHKSREVKVFYNAIYHLRQDGSVTRNDTDYTISLSGAK